MKKVVLVFIALLVLLIPLFSAPATATLYVIWQQDTGRPAGPDGVARIGWEFEACEYLYNHRVVTITLRHTTPKRVGPGEFNNPVVVDDWDPATGIWSGYVEFESVLTNGDRGTNHGDIVISFTSGYPSVEWSFNIRHR